MNELSLTHVTPNFALPSLQPRSLHSSRVCAEIRLENRVTDCSAGRVTAGEKLGTVPFSLNVFKTFGLDILGSRQVVLKERDD